MAFSGTPVVKSLGHYIVRVTGAVLNGGQSGTIGVAGSGAQLILPNTFPTVSDDPALTMADICEASYQRTDTGGLEATHLHVDKQSSPFMVTFTNDLQQPSGILDIYVKFHHSLVR